ncbi:uncharacterized protein LOC106082139 [Stomoxys calcitrans]|uniref:Peptidase C1A papain C-terminal domain-containing protein n=1 Tax=Stomoxys calcitrans TaxID=35570 RepID=A0A1I8Q742_STOCA|nr:uncharacterized protein LOC106082139 [Stomoxys calcitrans]
MYSFWSWSAVYLVLVIIQQCLAINHVPEDEWEKFKTDFGKTYPSNGISEALAQYYYAYNKRLIDNHNAQFNRGQKTFELKVNQFTDMRLIHFNALFPKAIAQAKPNAWPGPETLEATTVYNPSEHFGYVFNVEDQGTKCNSGWAYAAAKAVELMQAQQTGDLAPETLSAQNLIDCAGGARACKNQVPQVALEYLTVHEMDLYPESEYMNNNSLNEPGMCVPQGTMPTNLAEFSVIPDGDDDELKRYVSSGFPVIVEVNPASFEFMHYFRGVYQPSTTSHRNHKSTKGSHFMVVIGYDKDEKTNEEYWILQNSFGLDWGERGLMRMLRSPTQPITKNAIFPSKLGPLLGK